MAAAAGLLAEGGREAVSTRGVSNAAHVQPPAIYRIFGDMQGLLDAVVSYGFQAYLDKKINRPHAADPVDDLREGWDAHVGFGVANPEFYKLMYGQPVSGTESEAAKKAAEILIGLVERVAKAGRLAVGVERAAQMIHSAGCGVTLTLIGTPPESRDPELSERTREAILAAVITEGPRASGAGRPSAVHAVALKAVLSEAEDTLSPGERHLLTEWLDRISHSW
ncbi:TetR family transcriptional regulator [Planotetraspora thailandica]|uniref:TetR family transcriptional regulator n=1 Tax=Planotetraspora thailandica TaxID=487172 RepID=A0A8J3XVL5_9ACTN|nr:TetR family transcriptional regulator [Planotetraspora thailandica]